MIFGIFSYRYNLSNWGECVDIYAPGANIESAWIHSKRNDNIKLLSGTSMATPFVSGVVALYLEREPNSTPEKIRNYLLNDAIVGVLYDDDSKQQQNDVKSKTTTDDEKIMKTKNLLVNVQGLLLSPAPIIQTLEPSISPSFTPTNSISLTPTNEMTDVPTTKGSFVVSDTVSNTLTDVSSNVMSELASYTTSDFMSSLPLQ